MRIIILPLVFFLSALIFLVSCNTAYAFENDIGQSQIHPVHPFYFLKTVKEGLEMSLALTPRVKSIRNLEFATRRLREAKTLVPMQRQDLIEPTLERYWYYISQLHDEDLKDQEVAVSIKQSLVIHLKTLEKIYSQVSNPRAKMSIRSTLNRLMGRGDIPDDARLPVCNLFIFEASTAANLNETERIILTERSQKCLESLKLNSHS